MRQDQFERLQAITEKLTDVLLKEADPDNWPGAVIPIDQQDKTMRGDRYWCKKNAVATVALIIRNNTLAGQIRSASAAGKGGEEGAVVPEESSLDAEIAEAEKEADKLLKRMSDPAAKAKFDERAHGKT